MHPLGSHGLVSELGHGGDEMEGQRFLAWAPPDQLTFLEWQ